MKWIAGIFDKILALAGALVLSQGPVFMQAYTHQLSGHVAELQWQMDAMQRVAAQSGKSLNQFVEKFLTSQDKDFALQGQLMWDTMERWHNYSEGLFALQNATVWTRPFVFIRHFEWNIVQSTYESYDIGLTLNIEGIVYALIGMLIGYLIAVLLRQMLAWAASPFYRKGKINQEQNNTRTG